MKAEAAIQNTQGIVSARAKSGQNVLGEFSGDPFLEIIMRMVQGAGEGETETEAETETGLGLEQAEGIFGVETDREITESYIQNNAQDNTETSNMLMGFAAMMNINPVTVSQVSQEDLQALSNMSEEVITQAVQTETQQAAVVNEMPTETVNLQNAATQQPQQKETQSKTEFVMTETVADELNLKDAKSTFTTQTAEPATKQEFMQQERQFSTAIDTARKQMQGQKDTQPVVNETAEPKIQPTQIDLSSKKVEFTEFKMEKPELAEQIKTQINTHLAKGDSEFTMKLKPEALGEITIKMLRSGGKLTVDIAAASQKTTQLLNSEIAALREVLKPMQAEVRQVTTVDGGEINQQPQQFNMSGHNFANQQNQSSNHQSHRNSFGDELYFDEEVLQQEALNDNSNLKVYI